MILLSIFSQNFPPKLAGTHKTTNEFRFCPRPSLIVLAKCLWNFLCLAAVLYAHEPIHRFYRLAMSFLPNPQTQRNPSRLSVTYNAILSDKRSPYNAPPPVYGITIHGVPSVDLPCPTLTHCPARFP